MSDEKENMGVTLVKFAKLIANERDEIKAERDQLQVERDALLVACRLWIAYFDRLQADSGPDDPLAVARERTHGQRIFATRAAIALAEKCKAVGPYHGDPCNGGRVQAPNAQFTEACPACRGTGKA